MDKRSKTIIPSWFTQSDEIIKKLVDGPNLLNLLREHGKKYKIDLEEAKLLNKEE